MDIRKATPDDCRFIAELALIAGEGIPAYFWKQSRKNGEDIIDVGARNAASESENFSYRNTRLAIIDGNIAGMLLAYRLPNAEHTETLEDFPEFIRPLIELEQCVPDSFYINMLSAYPEFRNRGIGTALMSIVDKLAIEAGCDTISVEVFEQNEGALRLYQRLGYNIVEHREVIPHPCHPYQGKIFLMTKDVNSENEA
ncbi:MAG: GNAT family N-acetyltransferase [Gammaproteobacteria bacterium]|jgi:ribosomal protein S18 acetylase RimI-like enzyme